MDFETYEDLTGLRFAWNIIPADKKTAQKCSVPISGLYQPLRPKTNQVIVQASPTACRQCRAILAPCCPVDVRTRQWTCPFCQVRNALPGNAGEIPYAASPEADDIEYVVPPPEVQKPFAFCFVVDSCFDEQAEFDALKDSLLVALSSLPPDALISFIVFGKHVNVYEIGRQDSPTFYSFNGAKDYSEAEVSKKLDVPQATSRFVQQHTICDFNLTTLIDSLKVDSFPTPAKCRRTRATGCAIAVATHMMSQCLSKTGARIILFSGGPCTEGPGKIVGSPLKEPLRSHHDLTDDSKMEKQYRSAEKHYTTLATKAARNGHTVDIMIGCYDQVGLAEMEALPNLTGGVVVQSDSFTSAIFKRSMQKLFEPDEQTGLLQFGLNATLQLKVTNSLKVKSIYGHQSKLQGTENAWKLGAVWPHSAYGFHFERTDVSTGSGQHVAVQFITTYQHADGSRRVHVTSAQRSSATGGNDTLLTGFDQESAAVLVAREAVAQLTKDLKFDAVRYLDKILIDLCRYFGTYRAGDSSTFSVPPELSLFPQFIYHLRRSPFVQVFNSSPDETAYYRHCFLAEDCMNSLVMIQPTLTSYQLEKEPEPVVLDSTSLQPDRILLLDTFFHLLIYHGATVAEWRRQGYQDQPDYAYFKEFLAQPRQEAADILVDRFPLPRFIDTEEGGSQARFLMSRLSPTTSYKSVDNMVNMAHGEQGAVIMTDDVSLATFMDYVKRIVVKVS